MKLHASCVSRHVLCVPRDLLVLLADFSARVLRCWLVNSIEFMALTRRAGIQLPGLPLARTPGGGALPAFGAIGCSVVFPVRVFLSESPLPSHQCRKFP